MKKVLLLGVILAGMAPAARSLGQDRPEQKPEPKASLNVTGKWSMVLEMSMGTGTPTLDLKQEAEKITGTYTGRYGTFKLEGTLKERAIAFSFPMTAEGVSVTMSFTGEVAADGLSMKGDADIEGMGEATWTAKKDKETVNQGRHGLRPGRLGR
jgi:hypothetical protein